MAVQLPPPATEPTMYFVGVTTGKSSIMKVFPAWAKALGIDAVLKGIDVEIHADPDDYRQVVDFIAGDPLSMGALVTTHKIDLLTAARDRFGYLDPNAEILGEISSISKRGDQLRGHAKDPITSGLALEAFLPDGWWIAHPEAQALIFGAGGSSLAISMYMMDPARGDNRPSKIVVTNRSVPRIDEMKRIHAKLDSDIPVEYHHCPEFDMNDAVLATTTEYSVVMNSTGLGKDRPGSPITDAAIFPCCSLAWDFNYRGDLHFLVQARAQKEAQNLTVEDGWIYFVHGWSQVVTEVFDLTITPEMIDELSRIASEVR